MKISIEFHMRLMPNFLRAKCSREIRIDVAKLSDDEVKEFCEQWAEAFKAHVKKRREAQK